MRLEDLTEREQQVIAAIVETGGEDYEVWPRIDHNMFSAVNALDERDIIAVMGNGDIRIIDREIEAEALGRLNKRGEVSP